ncbi:MAG: gluconolactonase, partial [Chloroflexales bacterium]|nr:gluconolactonase [Chloroflexales bacterium]
MELEILAEGLAFPEGPAFAPDGALWFVELEVGALTRYDAGKLSRYPCGGMPNGLAFDHAGHAWICDAGQRSVRRFDPATGNWTTVVDARAGSPLLAP